MNKNKDLNAIIKKIGKLANSVLFTATLGLLLAYCSDGKEVIFPPANNEEEIVVEKEKYTCQYSLAAENYNMPTAGIIMPEYEEAEKGCNISKLIDGDWNSKFSTPYSNFSIVWKGNKAVTVTYYSILATGDNTNTAPKAWSLYASNDNENWIQLDNRVRQTFEGQEKKILQLANQEAYQYYKLTIHQNQGGEQTAIQEWTLQEKRLQNFTTLTDFPEGSTPKEVGLKLSKLFAKGTHSGKTLGYAETFTWNGSLKYAHLAGEEELLETLKDGFEPFFTTDNSLLPAMNHVDKNMFGSLPLSLYLITKEDKYKEMGLPFADTQWEVPDDASTNAKNYASQGYSWQTRLWIDDMYMITIVQTHAYVATNTMKYLDRAAKEMAMYLSELQRGNGLFYHAPDVPYYWGRGNGWVAAGMTEILRHLPDSSPYYLPILRGYQKMMKTLQNYQTEEGMWRQLIDQDDFWIETSGSAMFTYALTMGIKYGWLSVKEYEETVRKGWLGMVTYINSDGKVREVCVGTNKKNDKQYYYDRARNTGDYHGQAPYLWCTVTLLEQ